MESISTDNQKRLDDIRQSIDRQRMEAWKVRCLAAGILSMPVRVNEAIGELTETLEWTLDQIEDLVIDTERAVSGD